MAKPKSPGLFISDSEISALVGDRASEALAGLNANLDTQHKATMPAGKRSRSTASCSRAKSGQHNSRSSCKTKHRRSR